MASRKTLIDRTDSYPWTVRFRPSTPASRSSMRAKVVRNCAARVPTRVSTLTTDVTSLVLMMPVYELWEIGGYLFGALWRR